MSNFREKTTAILLIAIIMISMMAFVSSATGSTTATSIDYPTITPDPTYGPPGTMVVGAHFIAMEKVTLEFWDKELSAKVAPDIATLETDSNGDFSCTFRVPPVDLGTYIIVAQQDNYQITASIYFNVRTHEGIELRVIAKGSGVLTTIETGEEPSFQPFKGTLKISCSAELEFGGPSEWPAGGYDYYIPTDTLEVEGLISMNGLLKTVLNTTFNGLHWVLTFTLTGAF